MNTLGKRIAIAREKLGLNQSELARQIDVTPQAVQKWEMAFNRYSDAARYTSSRYLISTHQHQTPLLIKHVPALMFIFSCFLCMSIPH